MKIINLFKSVLLTFSFTFFFYFNSLAFTLVETPIALDAAWGMTWIDDEQMLITQKSGEVFLVNSLDYSQIKVLHDLPFVQYGQGGLLDIVSEGNTIWFTGSIEKEKKYTTAIFQATLSGNKLINENDLCQKLCGIYKSNNSCFRYTINECSGACIKLEDSKQYNNRLTKAIKYLNFENKNFAIIDKGRNIEENSFELKFMLSN